MKADIEKEIGENYYFTGIPCKNGHVAKRYKINRSCTECTKQKTKKIRKENPERIREYQRRQLDNKVEWQRKNPESRLAWARRNRLASPEKYKARNTLNNQIRAGNIRRPDSCQNCGCPERLDAHHSDYSKPLDVKWLCFKCHCKEHGRNAR